MGGWAVVLAGWIACLSFYLCLSFLIATSSSKPIGYLPTQPPPPKTQVIQHPVCAADGHIYERDALESWFNESDISPLVGKRMTRRNVPAHTFAKATQEVMERLGAWQEYMVWSEVGG